MSFLANAGDAFVDKAADRLVNDIVPGGNGKNDFFSWMKMVFTHWNVYLGLIGGALQTGIDQVVNNDINRDLGGGLGSTGGNMGGGFLWNIINWIEINDWEKYLLDFYYGKETLEDLDML